MKKQMWLAHDGTLYPEQLASAIPLSKVTVEITKPRKPRTAEFQGYYRFGLPKCPYVFAHPDPDESPSRVRVRVEEIVE